MFLIAYLMPIHTPYQKFVCFIPLSSYDAPLQIHKSTSMCDASRRRADVTKVVYVVLLCCCSFLFQTSNKFLKFFFYKKLIFQTVVSIIGEWLPQWLIKGPQPLLPLVLKYKLKGLWVSIFGAELIYIHYIQVSS